MFFSYASLGGSFRHFLWQVVRELQSSMLPLLLPCPSSSIAVNQGKYILAPGPISYAEEKLLQFFGQVSNQHSRLSTIYSILLLLSCIIAAIYICNSFCCCCCTHVSM